MALIKCHECGQKIADRADVCPKCGATTQHAQNNAMWFLATGLLLCGAFLWWIARGS